MGLDHKISNNNNLYFISTTSGAVFEQPARVLPLDVIGPLTRLRASKTFSVSDSHIFSPTVINELRVGFNRINWPLHGPLTGKTIVDEMGLTGYPGEVPDDVFGFPIVAITGFQEISEEDDSRDIMTMADVHNNLSWRRGRHMLKFGTNFQYIQASGFLSTPSRVYGSFSFDGSLSGHPYADYLLGLPRTASRAGVVPPRYQRDKVVHFFGQDDWNVYTQPHTELRAALQPLVPLHGGQRPAGELRPGKREPGGTERERTRADQPPVSDDDPDRDGGSSWFSRTDAAQLRREQLGAPLRLCVPDWRQRDDGLTRRVWHFLRQPGEQGSGPSDVGWSLFRT